MNNKIAAQTKRKMPLTVKRILLHGLFCGIILKLFFSFSFHLKSFGAVSYAIDGMVIMLCVATIIFARGNLNKQFFPVITLATIFIFYIAAQSLVYEVAIKALLYYSRFYLPLFLLIGLVQNYDVVDKQLVKKYTTFIFYLIFFLGFIGLFFMPENFNHFEVKMPTYFSGLHKSGYIFTSALILMVCLFPEKSFMEKILMLIITSFAGYMLLFGWGIRTPLLMLFVFFLIKRAFGSSSTLAPLLFFLLPIFLFMCLILLVDNIDWTQLSSGRLVMWRYKLDMLDSSTLSQLIFGRGYGSDLAEVSGWWGAKDSHNNYLQTITEFGIVGLLMLLATIVAMAKSQVSIVGYAIVAVYALSGMVSNGVIYRLLPGYIFSLLLFYQFVSQQKKIIKKIEL